jgi:hypothetical protein
MTFDGGISMRFHNKALGILFLLLALLAAGCGGGGSGASVNSEQLSSTGSLTLRLNTAAIPRMQGTAGTPDSIVIDILNPATREAVHPRTQFIFDRNLAFQSFTVDQVVPGTHIVRIEIFDSTGASFFAGEQQAVLNPGQPTAVAFSITGGTTPGGGTGAPSDAFLCVDGADDEQGQPDVDITDDGFFFVIGRVTDASTDTLPGDFDSYGFIHGERFQATFDGTLPVSIDETNGNNGDFDLSQFSTLDSLNMFQFDQDPVFPRISTNSSGTSVIAWLDKNPHESAGGGLNSTREDVVRSVIIGRNTNTTTNSSGFVEPEFFTPQSEPNVFGPEIGGLATTSVSMTNAIAGGNAFIDYATFVATSPESDRFTDGGVSQNGVPPNSAPPINPVPNPIVTSFDDEVLLSVSNRRTDANGTVVAGLNTVGATNRVTAEILSPPAATGATAVINDNQPSESDPTDMLVTVEVDWFESGTIVVVYSITDSSLGGTGVYARCFNSNLSAALGPEIPVAVAAGGVDNIKPDVAAVNADGTFLVTWTEMTGGATPTTRVLLQRFECATGARTPATPIQVDAGQSPPVVAGQNTFSRVACTTFGDAVVVWQTGTPTVGFPNVRLVGRLYPNASTQ